LSAKADNSTQAPREALFPTYTPPEKADYNFFRACGRETLRGFFDSFVARSADRATFFYNIAGKMEKAMI